MIDELSEEIEISEPRVAYLKTYPIEFGGKRWWLTKEEMNHLKLIQQYFPANWESEVYRQMDSMNLGYPERDLNLRVKIKRVVG